VYAVLAHGYLDGLNCLADWLSREQLCPFLRRPTVLRAAANLSDRFMLRVVHLAQAGIAEVRDALRQALNPRTEERIDYIIDCMTLAAADAAAADAAAADAAAADAAAAGADAS
jgi:hypothetical protein